MECLSIIFLTSFFLLILKYILPFLIQYIQLRQDYRDISFLPLSSFPLVGNLHQIDSRGYVFFQLLCQMSKECQIKRKGIFCLWYAIWPITFVCAAKGLETFISNSKQLVKSFDYKLFEPWLKTGLLTSNNDKWRTRRRLITPSFHDTELLRSFIHIFNEQAIILTHRLEQLAQQSNKTYDLYPYISACTLDIIAETATGTHLKAQFGDENNTVVQATTRIGEIINCRMRFPWLWPAFIFNQLPIGREHNRLLKILHDCSRQVIEERLVAFNADEMNCKRRLVFLDSLLIQMHAQKLSLDDIQEEVDTFMFEGHDTTAAALNFFCYLMGCYPDIQGKVQAELDAIFADDRERPCTLEDIEQMTYLDCVIKESMRILPPVPSIAREAQIDFTYRDQIVRKGTTVFIFIYGIHLIKMSFPIQINLIQNDLLISH
ncbi:hypothetical protein I4U23_026846 [Adineta vaga]|nr:hypothetical protein I4U23_026846 [Adineta vaga]